MCGVCVSVFLRNTPILYFCVQMGRLDEAIADYSRAIELDPKNSNAYHNRGSTNDKVSVVFYLFFT